MPDSLWPHGLKHVRPPYPSLSPGVCSNSGPLSWWCYLTISSNWYQFSSVQFSCSVMSNSLWPHGHPAISSSVVPFSSCLQSFPVWGSLPVSLLFVFSSVQSLSCVWLFVAPWIAARQASLSITISRRSLRLRSILGLLDVIRSRRGVTCDWCWWRYMQSWRKSFPWSRETHHVKPLIDDEVEKLKAESNSSKALGSMTISVCKNSLS